jgi:hypothetical protein
VNGALSRISKNPKFETYQTLAQWVLVAAKLIAKNTQLLSIEVNTEKVIN